MNPSVALVEALRTRPEVLLTAPPGVPYRIRLVSFAGRPPQDADFGVPWIPLVHVVGFVTGYLERYRPILHAAPFGDPALGLLKLLDKLGLRVDGPAEAP